MKKKKAKLHEDMAVILQELRQSVKNRELWIELVLKERHSIFTFDQIRGVCVELRRKRYLMNEGYRVNSMGLCYRRWAKLSLGGRRVRVALFMIVVLQGVNKSC